VVRAPLPVHGKALDINAPGRWACSRHSTAPSRETTLHSMVVDRASSPTRLATVAATDDRLVRDWRTRPLPCRRASFTGKACVRARPCHSEEFLDLSSLAPAKTAAAGRREAPRAASEATCDRRTSRRSMPRPRPALRSPRGSRARLDRMMSGEATPCRLGGLMWRCAKMRGGRRGDSTGASP